MPRLVPIETREGFLEELQRTWDAGDAVLPLDIRLPRPAAGALVERMRAGDEVEPGDALVVPTSGSTGEPKGVVLTFDALRASAEGGNTLLGVDPTVDGWLACLPLSHMAALGVVTRCLLTGTKLDVHYSFDAAGAEAVARAGPTLTTLVPTAYRRIDPGLFRTIIVGGAPVPGGLPANVSWSYGLTETAGGVFYDGLPFPGTEVRVDEAGQIHLRGPALLRAYRDGRDPKTADGWLATGDAGEVDGDGRLQIRGRLSDLIITGGENVWPAAVERVVRVHRSVEEVAVAGRPDPEWGERVVAWVVPADAAAPPTLESVRDHVKEHLPAFCAPRELVLVEDLPRTPSGKVRAPTVAPDG